nr:NADH dehydrogenase subunit 6 [Terrapotamon thungwa]
MSLYTIPFIITLSFLFTQVTHPLAMGLTLLIQTIFISFIVGLSTYSFWFSYILFLILLGGMLVLFIYIASLASNEFFYFPMTLMMTSLTLLIILFMSITLLDLIITSTFSNLPNSSINTYSSTAHTTSWIFNTPSMFFTIFIISYLLLTLLVVVKIINLFKGPLRLMN